MRLLEMFTLLELRDRLAHIADTMQGKIAQRWEQHVQEAGFVGLPQDWKAMYRDGKLPDESVMSVDGWAKGWPGLNDMARSVVEWFASHDPTKNKKYTDWLLRQWLKERVYLEDVYKAQDTLAAFEEHRKKLAKLEIVDMEGQDIGPPPQRRADINAWQDYATLAYAMRPLVGTRAAGEKVQNFMTKPEVQDMMTWPVPDPVQAFGMSGEFDLDDIIDNWNSNADAYGHGGAPFDTMDWFDVGVPDGDEVEVTHAIEKVYADDKIAILNPNTRAAACELGRGTEWCTAATQSDNAFWQYAPDGPLYVIVTDKHGKYQFHFDSGQFMDVHDVPLRDEAKAELVQEYPQLAKVFHDEAAQHGHVWLMDPEQVTQDWVAQKAREAMSSMYGSEGINTLRRLPKGLAGRADEAALAEAEAFLRHHDPLDAFRYVRQPTEDDYQRALTAEDSGIRQYDPSGDIIRSAKQNGVNLSDETLEMLVARNGERILELPIDRVQANPGWLLAAIQSQPRTLEQILNIAHGTSGWGGLIEPHEEEAAKALYAMLLQSGEAGRKAVHWAGRHVPELTSYDSDQYQRWKQGFEGDELAQDVQGQEQGQNQGDLR